MAYQNKDMSVIAYANGFTMWHYRTDDSIELVEEYGYFPKPVAKLMGLGDVILITTGSTTCFRQVLNLDKLVPTIGRLN